MTEDRQIHNWSISIHVVILQYLDDQTLVILPPPALCCRLAYSSLISLCIFQLFIFLLIPFLVDEWFQRSSYPGHPAVASDRCKWREGNVEWRWQIVCDVDFLSFRNWNRTVTLRASLNATQSKQEPDTWNRNEQEHHEMDAVWTLTWSRCCDTPAASLPLFKNLFFFKTRVYYCLFMSPYHFCYIWNGIASTMLIRQILKVCEQRLLWPEGSVAHSRLNRTGGTHGRKSFDIYACADAPVRLLKIAIAGTFTSSNDGSNINGRVNHSAHKERPRRSPVSCALNQSGRPLPPAPCPGNTFVSKLSAWLRWADRLEELSEGNMFHHSFPPCPGQCTRHSVTWCNVRAAGRLAPGGGRALCVCGPSAACPRRWTAARSSLNNEISLSWFSTGLFIETVEIFPILCRTFPFCRAFLERLRMDKINSEINLTLCKRDHMLSRSFVT